MIQKNLNKISYDSSVDERWQRALKFYRSKEKVVFISGVCRYWEKHAFVQQSLAKILTDNAIKVDWFDGTHWKKYQPVHYWNSPFLKVKQLHRLPGDRFSIVQKINMAYLNRQLKGLENSLVWVQASLDDKLSETIKNIDVFSVFDDPYCQSLNGDLCKRAKAIICQNDYAKNYFNSQYSEKTHLILPPVEIFPNTVSSERYELPEGFPTKRMGYIGSFYPDGFDFDLFETFLRRLPDWGFLLMGRTNSDGAKFIQKFQSYANFHYVNWQERKHVAAVWRLLNLCLLLYRPVRISDGAFPVKILESLHFGVPFVATRVNKTSSLEGVCSRTSFPEQLIQQAVKASEISKSELQNQYEKFKLAMDPKMHLIRVAEILMGV